MSRVKANTEVSQAILDAMAKGTKGKPAVSNQEWAKIKKTALAQLRKANNPKYEFKKIVKSFDDMNKVLDGKYEARTEKFVEGDLAETKKDRQEDVGRSPRVSSWGGYGSYRSGS